MNGIYLHNPGTVFIGWLEIAMVEHKVNIPANEGGSYEIVIGAEILPSLWGRIEADFGRYNKFVVTDENLVRAGHLQKLAGGREFAAFVISPAGEISRNINTVVHRQD